MYGRACGFTSPPNDGGVEIAYITFPEFEDMELPREWLAELIKIARKAEPNALVYARTLPEKNASTAVLTKLGFTNLGEIQVPEDGSVWEWKLLNS